MSARHHLLLVSPPPYLSGGPPLGIACLSAHLKARGFRVASLDLNAEINLRIRPEARLLWDQARVWERKELLLQELRGEIEWAADQILAVDAEVIGFSVTNHREIITCEIIKAMAERGDRRHIIIGGQGCLGQIGVELIRREVPGLVQAIFVGEGEVSLTRYLESLRGGGRLDRTSRPQIFTAIPLADMDQLSVPDFEAHDLDRLGHHTLFVEWSRGCVRGCSFCQVGAMWGGYRRKSPARITDEIEQLVRRTGITQLSVCDSVVNGDPGALGQTCELLIRSDISCRWSGHLLLGDGLDAQLITQMARSGCYRLEVGVESGSERVLRLMRKSFTIKQAAEQLAEIKHAGIMTVIFLIVGYPGETPADFQQTCEFLRRNHQSIDLVRSINTLSLMEQTPLARALERHQIKLAPDHVLYANHWEDLQGLSLEGREARVWELQRLCDELGVRREISNTADIPD